MSKAILVIDMPDCCGDCEMSGTGVCKKWNMKDLKTFPKACPLKRMPQKLAEEDRWFSKDYAIGFNSCIDEILNGRGIIKVK